MLSSLMIFGVCCVAVTKVATAEFTDVSTRYPGYMAAMRNHVEQACHQGRPAEAQHALDLLCDMASQTTLWRHDVLQAVFTAVLSCVAMPLAYSTLSGRNYWRDSAAAPSVPLATVVVCAAFTNYVGSQHERAHVLQPITSCMRALLHVPASSSVPHSFYDALVGQKSAMTDGSASCISEARPTSF